LPWFTSFFGSIDPKPAAIGVGIGVFFAVFGTSGIWKSQDQSRDRPRAILTIAFFLFIVVWIGCIQNLAHAIFSTGRPYSSTKQNEAECGLTSPLSYARRSRQSGGSGNSFAVHVFWLCIVDASSQRRWGKKPSKKPPSKTMLTAGPFLRGLLEVFVNQYFDGRPDCWLRREIKPLWPARHIGCSF